jgi:hypothetical protein
MTISRILAAKTTSISGTEVDLFTIIRPNEALRIERVKKHNTVTVHSHTAGRFKIRILSIRL